MIKLYLFVLIPILLSVIIYLSSHKWTKLVVIAIQGVVFAGSVINFFYIKKYGPIVESLGGWADNVGITLMADSLSIVMVMLTTLLFTCLIIYDYPKTYVNNLFLFLFVVLQALLTGIFLSRDLFNIFVLIEVSTIIVGILIMFKTDSRSIYDGIVYLIVNIVAMAFFLFGTGFLYKYFGALDMEILNNRMAFAQSFSSLILPYCFIITAVSLKSALLPLFSWLPKAHATPGAPTIVSAVLSGLYVKAGIYLFIRINDMFYPYIDTSQYFLVMGFLTGAAGFIFALSQTNIKLLLAYSTISQIGLIMIGLNIDHEAAFWGGVYHIISHSFFKSTLFLTAGIIIEEYGTRDMRKITGVFKKMPIISIACFLAMLGITGAPLFNGSISKYLIESTLKGTFYEYALLLVNLGTAVYFMKFISIFFGGSEGPPVKIHPCRRGAALFLGVMCFLGGVLGERFIEFLFNASVDIDITGYAVKALLYFGTIAAAWFIYKKVLPHLKLLKKIKGLELGFNDICLSIAIFFFTALLYLSIKYSVIDLY